MNALILIGIIICICKLISSASSRSAEQRKTDTWKRIAQEQNRIREEQNRAILWQQEQERRNREEMQKRIAMEKAIAKAKKEREQMRKEQERQAKAIQKHEEEIVKLKQTVEQTSADIAFLEERSAELYAQLDFVLLQQSATTPGSKEFERYQSKIVTLHNQIHSTENRLSKAQFNRTQAQRKLSA